MPRIPHTEYVPIPPDTYTAICAQVQIVKMGEWGDTVKIWFEIEDVGSEYDGKRIAMLCSPIFNEKSKLGGVAAVLGVAAESDGGLELNRLVGKRALIRADRKVRDSDGREFDNVVQVMAIPRALQQPAAAARAAAPRANPSQGTPTTTRPAARPPVARPPVARPPAESIEDTQPSAAGEGVGDDEGLDF
jgi:hypothetical protein